MVGKALGSRGKGIVCQKRSAKGRGLRLWRSAASDTCTRGTQRCGFPNSWPHGEIVESNAHCPRTRCSEAVQWICDPSQQRNDFPRQPPSHSASAQPARHPRRQLRTPPSRSPDQASMVRAEDGK